jgi:type IV pilus assembly protein PilZ
MAESDTTSTLDAGALRASLLQFSPKDANTLYAHYIKKFAYGGIFVPTARDFEMGAEVIVALSLPQRPERFALGGRVAWVTPAKAPHGRSQGVGIAFENDDKSKAVRDAIEAALGDLLRSGRGTQTL